MQVTCADAMQAALRKQPNPGKTLHEVFQALIKTVRSKSKLGRTAISPMKPAGNAHLSPLVPYQERIVGETFIFWIS